MKNKRDLTGQKFGNLTVVEEAGRSKNNTILWKCKCDCGNETISFSTSLRNGDAKSCGCIRIEKSTKHGLYKHKLTSVWYDMMHRCYDKKNKHYKDYGGRGINVCEKWHSIESFIDDMNDTYVEHKANNETTQIDRINNDGNYEPNNCRWATSYENNSNTRNMVKFIAISPSGKEYESKNQSEFARVHNLDSSAISKCLKGKHKQHKRWIFKVKI
jgi:ribosomal protein S27E